MSAEYFSIEEIKDQSKFYEGFCAPKMTRTPEDRYFTVDEIEEIAVSSKKSQERLHEIEEQLEQADYKCQKLKNQLDFMRKIYQQGDFRKFPQSHSFDETIYADQKKKKRFGKDFPIAQSVLLGKKDFLSFMRQNSNAIGTDTTGAAVKTINNILSGITDSVNRLSELHSHVHDGIPEPAQNHHYKPVKDVAVGDDKPENSLKTPIRKCDKVDITDDTSTSIEKVTEISKKRSSTHSMKPVKKVKKSVKRRVSKSKHSNVSIGSSKIEMTESVIADRSAKRSFLQPRIPESKTKSRLPIAGTKIISRKSKRQSQRNIRSKTTIVSKTQLLHSSSKSQNLVELFHNNAVKESDSDGSNTCVKRGKHNVENIPPLQIDMNQQNSSKMYDNQENCCQNQVNNYVEPATPRIGCSDPCGVKRYELPTIASRMKQVDKGYWKNFDVRAIPFCPVTSTSPSHNIGLNIQQVMSIIKTRQPLSGISPTLAHNIGLAAGKLNSSPLSTLMTTLGSRVRCGKSQCPLAKDSLNYQKLYELAKEIPDNMVTDGLIDAGQGDAKLTSNAAFLADNDKGRYPETCWTLDTARNNRCTCFPQKTMECNHNLPLQKYHSSMTYDHIESASLQQQRQYHPVSQPSWSHNPTKINEIIATQCYNYIPSSQYHSSSYYQEQIKENYDNNMPSNLQGKEKSLKTVLQNLHDEFEILNSEYDDLANRIEKEEVKDVKLAKEQLESMERNLNNKEEEIQIVMALYKEVMALKEQVKKLKQRSSTATVVSYCSPKINGVRDKNAVIHLTKLLKQIQSYQKYYYLRKTV